MRIGSFDNICGNLEFVCAWYLVSCILRMEIDEEGGFKGRRRERKVIVDEWLLIFPKLASFFPIWWIQLMDAMTCGP